MAEEKMDLILQIKEQNVSNEGENGGRGSFPLLLSVSFVHTLQNTFRNLSVPLFDRSGIVLICAAIAT